MIRVFFGIEKNFRLYVSEYKIYEQDSLHSFTEYLPHTLGTLGILMRFCSEVSSSACPSSFWLNFGVEVEIW